MKPLAPHAHTGKWLPHHHTSYAALLFLSLVAGVMLMLATKGALASNPATGQVQINATVHGPAPTQAPVITNPFNGQHVTTSPIPVEGTCIAFFKVAVFKDGLLAGTGLCQADGTFSIRTDLLFGRNQLTARQYDYLDQASPESTPVVVFYDAPVSVIPPPGVSQLELRTDSPYKTGNPGDQFIWPVQVLGGTPPYALSWNWGDGSIDVVSMTSPGTYNGKHVYAKPGTYHLIIKASDSRGQQAYLELVAIVGGEVGPATTKPSSFFDGGLLLILWPLYLLMLAMIISFWLGERFEFYKLRQIILRYRRVTQP